MNSICIPMPALEAGQNVDLEVSISGRPRHFQYRVERVNFADTTGSSDLDRLRRYIREYDRNWQLVQIGAPEKGLVPIMFRRVGYDPN